jgi:uncharacterized membrane protein YtjA (UPF0391 family)
MFTWLLLIAALTATAVLFGPSSVAAAAVGAAKILGVVILLLGAIAFTSRGRTGPRSPTLARSMSTVRPR